MKKMSNKKKIIIFVTIIVLGVIGTCLYLIDKNIKENGCCSCCTAEEKYCTAQCCKCKGLF